MKRLLLVLILCIVVSVASQDIPPMAAVTGSTLTIYTDGGTQPVMDGRFGSMAWSPDGQYLAFTVLDAQPRLMLMQPGGTPVEVASPVSHLPATFSTDSGQIIYTVYGDTTSTSPDGWPQTPLVIYSAPINQPQQAASVGEITFGVGCGGGSPFPMDTLYSQEAGFGGHGLTFTQTDSGILYSTTCAGVGLGLFDPLTGESTLLAADAANAVLSPDRTQVAAVRGGGIATFDLASASEIAYIPVVAPDQLAWGDTIYYSTRSLNDRPLPVSAEEAAALSQIGIAADGIPQYTVSIYRLNNGSPVYQGPGWAIGRMFVSRGTLYFSLIPNGTEWVEALGNGRLDPTAPDFYGQSVRAMPVILMHLNGEVGRDIGQAAPR